mmetsp:Transcript_101757/g.288191  ORF Transcript_101757/g.288191 Transcript_101757/m.288191 type:complete len:485 (-) Transcript_101757:31-1485(-)
MEAPGAPREESWLHPGVEARLCNLAKFPQFEGKLVQVLRYNEEKQRWNCLLPNGGDVNVYATNLELPAMCAEAARSVELMLEEGRVFEAWRIIKASAGAPRGLAAELEARLEAMSEVVDGRVALGEAPGGGACYRASRPIGQGEALLAGSALCSIDLRAAKQKGQAASAAPTPGCAADLIHELAGGRHALIRVLQKNILECTREPGVMSYFPVAARLGHSCCPNAFADSSRGACTVRALCDIREGEEVRISYVPVSGGVKERQEKLAREYGISCACRRCDEEKKSDPLFQVPCRCGRFSFASGTFEQGVRLNQLCPECRAPFDREESKNNLARVREANGRQADAVRAGSEQHEAVWSQVKRLAALEALVMPGAKSGVPPLHSEATSLLSNLADLHRYLATRIKGSQKTQAFHNFHRYKRLCLERLGEKHGALTNHRDPCYLRVLHELATAEGLAGDEKEAYAESLVEICQRCFGQPDIPPAMVR